MHAHEPIASVLHREIRVLIIEDETRYREFLHETIQEFGCAPTSMPNVMEAEEWLRDNEPDVLLLDLNLPVVDGMSFLQRFRETQQATPVIILTGVGDLETAQQAIRFGITEFLTKPCHLGTLEAAIDRARRTIAEQLRSSDNASVPASNETQGRSRSLAEIEREAIRDALHRHGGNRTAAAEELGISRRTLYNRLEQYRLQGLDGFD